MKSLVHFILKTVILGCFLILIHSSGVMAQCAMCKASVETNVNVDGIGLAAKLNAGILYLFVTPYLLAVIIGIMWYRKSREQRRTIMEAQQRRQRIANL